MSCYLPETLSNVLSLRVQVITNMKSTKNFEKTFSGAVGALYRSSISVCASVLFKKLFTWRQVKGQCLQGTRAALSPPAPSRGQSNTSVHKPLSLRIAMSTQVILPKNLTEGCDFLARFGAIPLLKRSLSLVRAFKWLCWIVLLSFSNCQLEHEDSAQQKIRYFSCYLWASQNSSSQLKREITRREFFSLIITGRKEANKENP